MTTFLYIIDCWNSEQPDKRLMKFVHEEMAKTADKTNLHDSEWWMVFVYLCDAGTAASGKRWSIFVNTRATENRNRPICNTVCRHSVYLVYYLHTLVLCFTRSLENEYEKNAVITGGSIVILVVNKTVTDSTAVSPDKHTRYTAHL